MAYIYGRNPVLESLEHQHGIQKIYIQYRNQGQKIKRIFRLARQQNIPITNADAKKLKKMVGNVTHQGVVALIAPIEIKSIELLYDEIEQLSTNSCYVLIDRIQDPHNMGAIIRSSEIFGANGLVFSSRNNVPITETVVKASAGAAVKVPLYKADNLAKIPDILKQKGLWIYGATTGGSVPLWKMDFNRACAIIIGGEEKGISPLLQKKCDQVFKIPQVGSTPSLNASVAAGIILAEVLRQRIS